eukprot:scaffold61398_cov41-Phaeocystis_antarctica.AAC.2
MGTPPPRADAPGPRRGWQSPAGYRAGRSSSALRVLVGRPWCVRRQARAAVQARHQGSWAQSMWEGAGGAVGGGRSSPSELL